MTALGALEGDEDAVGFICWEKEKDGSFLPLAEEMVDEMAL